MQLLFFNSNNVSIYNKKFLSILKFMKIYFFNDKFSILMNFYFKSKNIFYVKYFITLEIR